MCKQSKLSAFAAKIFRQHLQGAAAMHEWGFVDFGTFSYINITCFGSPLTRAGNAMATSGILTFESTEPHP